MAVDFDKLERDLSENEMALFIGISMAMFSAIEAGANQQNLLSRLRVHEHNFGVRGQHNAKHIIEALMAMAESTVRR